MRPRWMRGLGAVLVLAGSIPVLPAGAAAQQPAPPRRFVIDSHQHYQDKPDYFPRMAATYRPRNAMACVLTPFRHLEALKRGAAAYPDVVIPYGQVEVDDPAVLAQIDAFAAAGARGVKMHTPRRDWDHESYFPIYARLQEKGLLSLFHTGIVCTIVDGACGVSDEPQQSSMARMRPAFLHTIARAFPRLRIQGAHLGNPWYDEAAEAARWSHNLHFDVTGSTLIKKQNDLAVFKDYLWWQGPTAHSPSNAVYAFEKLVFGTDEPPEQLDNMLGRYEAMLTACEVPEASRRKIYGETMARLLGIPVRP